MSEAETLLRGLVDRYGTLEAVAAAVIDVRQTGPPMTWREALDVLEALKDLKARRQPAPPLGR